MEIYTRKEKKNCIDKRIRKEKKKRLFLFL